MKLKSLIASVTIAFGLNSVAHDDSANNKSQPFQNETLRMVASGPRTDGGANYVWDNETQRFILLDLYLWKRLTPMNPADFVARSQKLSALKTHIETLFPAYANELLMTSKEWYFVKDIDLSQYKQCENSVKLFVEKRIAACQTPEFVFIDANLFDAVKGETQDATILHEYAVGYAQRFSKNTSSEAAWSVAEFRIQRFVGQATLGQHDEQSLKSFYANVGFKNVTRAELDALVPEFEQKKNVFCQAALPYAGENIKTGWKKIDSMVMNRVSVEKYSLAHITLEEYGHPRVKNLPVKTYGQGRLISLGGELDSQVTEELLAKYNEIIKYLCAN